METGGVWGGGDSSCLSVQRGWAFGTARTFIFTDEPAKKWECGDRLCGFPLFFMDFLLSRRVFSGPGYAEGP